MLAFPTGHRALQILPVNLDEGRSKTFSASCLTTESNPGMAWTTVDIAIIAGVIAAVAFFLVCLLVLTLHYMYRHKGTYHTNEDKGTEFAETADVAMQDDLSLQEAGDNSRKEYFI
ncbi:glycophorin-C isoform X1 [Phyllostomus discolor]|uniref:Glycophorin-C isoform X1 n=1 Tax=Phyllostomus discolor TaxID=89673 RepID=A0A7E6DK34_9CHIR|nr:glycophorin-C isoform X1 [Phyllostomus discolor]